MILVLADYTTCTFSLQKEGSKEERIVTQFHFTSWPDHGVPQYPTALLHFIILAPPPVLILEIQGSHLCQPALSPTLNSLQNCIVEEGALGLCKIGRSVNAQTMVVNCSAGVVHTGTFLTTLT